MNIFNVLTSLSINITLYIINNIQNSEHSIAIALTVLAGNLTIFAFAYPYIYKSLDNIGKISEILLERVREKILIKYYWLFLLFLFAFDIISFILYFFIELLSPWIYVFMLIILLIHICYVMLLYEIIKKSYNQPLLFLKFNNLKNRTNNREIKKDIGLLQDLFLFRLKTDLGKSEINKCTEYFINITKYILDKKLSISIKKSSDKNSIMNMDFLTSNRMIFLNKRAVDSNYEEAFYNIDFFFIEIFDYCIAEGKKQKTKSENVYFFFRENLYRFKYVISYRIEKKIFDKYDIKNIWIILYYSFKLIDYNKNIKEDFYKNSFSLMCELIDLDYRESIITEIFRIINDGYISEYLYSSEKYIRIKLFHIIILAYMIFRNKYDLFYIYINFEESIERVYSKNKPQIPNTIYSIFSCFCGHDNVFNSIPVFSENISSVKYKFFVLFVLLMNSKNFADDILSKKKNFYDNKIYSDYYEKELELHSVVSENMLNNLYWDEILITKIGLFKEYKRYFIEFKQNNNFIEKINFENKHEIYIKEKIDDFIKLLDKRISIIFQTSIDVLIKKDFSLSMQKYFKSKNIEEYINSILDYIWKYEMKEFLCECSNEKRIESNILKNLSVEFDKKSFLNTIVSDYGNIIFDKVFRENTFEMIFNSIYKKCKKINTFTEICDEDISAKYIIITNLLIKGDFINVLHLNDNDVVIDKDTNRVLGIRFNGQEIKISNLSHYFKLEGQGIILLNKSKFKIAKNEKEKIKFEDILDTNKIKISYGNLFKIQCEETVGYILYFEKFKSNKNLN